MKSASVSEFLGSTYLWGADTGFISGGIKSGPAFIGQRGMRPVIKDALERDGA